jgi:CRISPR-associated protein Cas1
LDLYQILGIEGSAARTYFPRIFDNVKWQGRKARIKSDYVNASLDIGYTILFNIVDALLNVYGFDEYYGVLHRCFYMRKSLVCDLMEPMRPIIDYATRKAINLKQIKEEDFQIYNHRYILNWKKSPEYTQLYLKAILEYKEAIFLYIQGYYRAVMKQKPVSEYPVFLLDS